MQIITLLQFVLRQLNNYGQTTTIVSRVTNRWCENLRNIQWKLVILLHVTSNILKYC